MSNGTSSCPSVTLPFGLFPTDPTIAPLEASDFPPADQAPGLEQFIQDNAPTDATATDGFDAVFADTVGIVDALEQALDGLAGDLLDAFAEADLIDPRPVAGTVLGFTASLDPTSTAVDNLGKLIAGAGPPTPPGSGSTGGGGGRPSTCGMLDMGSHPFQLAGNTNFVTVVVYLTNNNPAAVTVKSATWTPAQAYGFRVLPPIDGAVIQPGGTLPITIVAGNGDVGTTRATLTVNTDGPDPQPCLNVTAEWFAGSGGSRIGDCGAGCADWRC